MTPGALRQMARAAEFTGLYLPFWTFWTFDAVNRADGKAQVGHTKTERYYSGGKWRTRTKTVWKWEYKFSSTAKRALSVVRVGPR